MMGTSSSLGAKTISASLPHSPADSFRANRTCPSRVEAPYCSSHPQRRSSSLLNSIVRARFITEQLDQPEHEDRFAFRVPSRVDLSTWLSEMLAWQKPRSPKSCVLVLGAGGFCFSFLRSRGWKAKRGGSWQRVTHNVMKSGARDTNSSARWEITGLTVEAGWRNR